MSHTFSPESAAGHTHCDSPGGTQLDLFGQHHCHVSPSPKRGNEPDRKTNATSGQFSSGSSSNADRPSSSGSKSQAEMRSDLRNQSVQASNELTQDLAEILMEKLGGLGSPLYELTWNRSVTQSLHLIYRLRASARRIYVNVFTGRVFDEEGHLLEVEFPDMLTVVSGWPTPQARDHKGASLNQKDRNTRPLNEVALLEGYQTPSVADAEGGHLTRGGARKNELLLPGEAKALIAGWRTPMAGTPKQKGYNEAGNTDYSRHCVEMLAGYPTPRAEDSESSGKRHNRGVSDTLTAVSREMAGWTTPRASDPKTGSHYSEKMTGKSLSMDASLAGYPTPNATDSTGPGRQGRQGRQGGANLQTCAAEMAGWPTPLSVPNSKASHSQVSGRYRETMKNILHGATSSGSPAQTARSGRLNPALSRWLMGYPLAWCVAAINAWHRSAPRKRGR